MIERVRLDRGLYVMLQVPIFRVGNIADSQQLLDFFPANVRHHRIAVFFVHDVVAGHLWRFAGRTRNLFPLFKFRNDPIHAGVFVG